MDSAIFQKIYALWVQYVLRTMLMYLWENLKEPIYIYKSMHTTVCKLLRSINY